VNLFFSVKKGGEESPKKTMKITVFIKKMNSSITGNYGYRFILIVKKIITIISVSALDRKNMSLYNIAQTIKRRKNND